MKQIAEFLRRLLRLLYLSLTNQMRAKLVSSGNAFIRHPALALPTLWDFVQFQVERRLHEYFHCARADIKTIVIAGANIGDEIEGLSNNYPQASFVCYEPSPRYFAILRKRLRLQPQSLTPDDGTRTGSRDGNGSLLAPDLADWQAFNQ